jgi:hypothetical protein
MSSDYEANGAGMIEPQTAAQDFAARAVQKAYREWREMRIQFVKGLNWKSSLEVDDDIDYPHSNGIRE